MTSNSALLFSCFFEALLETIQKKYKKRNVIIYLDNYWIHKTVLCKNIITKYDKIKLLFGLSGMR